MKDLLVIGSVNIDYSMGCFRLPQLGETIQGEGFTKSIGGKGLNQAVAAYKFNERTYFCGAIGSQDVWILDQLKDYGFKTEHMVLKQNVSTGVAMILKIDGDNVIVVDEGANACLSLTDVKQAVASLDVGMVVLQLELPLSLVRDILTYCDEIKVPVILNAAPAVALTDDDFKKIDTLILNETETEGYTGLRVSEDTLQTAGNYFIEKGVRHVVITLGARGSYHTTKSEHGYAKRYKTSVVDSTGAGDAFVGVYASALNELGNVEKSLDYASCAGSMTCEYEGTISASPLRRDLDSRVLGGENT